MDKHEIVRTWDSVRHGHLALISDFYKRLFARFPHYRPLFPESMDHQMIKMVSTIALVAQVAEGCQTVEPYLVKIGEKHGGYSLDRKDMENFKCVFLDVLEEECGSEWNEPCRVAWSQAFDELIIPMVMRGMGQR